MKYDDLIKIRDDPELRKKSVYEHPFWFTSIYLSDHLKYAFAPFHFEMFHLMQSDEYTLIAIMAFRESGKSTIMNMANVLWSILGKPKKKFVLIVSHTQEQAKNQFTNIKEELRNNELLRSDFGPFTDNENEWKKTSLELEYHESKVMSVSLDQGMRGLRYKGKRPDLIIVDDIEDISIAQDDITKEKIWQKFTSEILPLGSEGTKVIVLGNLICPDSILLRLKKYLDEKYIRGIFRAYPLLDDKRRILWPARWKNLNVVIRKKKGFTKGVWAREFLLKILGWSHGKDDDSGIYARIEKPGQYTNGEPEAIIYQKSLVEQMKTYAISVPIDTPKNHFSTEDNKTYQRYFGNVDIDGPMRSAEKQFEHIKALVEIHEMFFRDHWSHKPGTMEKEWKKFCKSKII